MAKDSDVETFCAVRLFIDSWRWAGVPWYLHTGKCLPETAAEVLVELKPPPQRPFDDSMPERGLANYLRFRLAPNPEIALAARVKRAGGRFLGEQRELSLLNAQPNQEQTYERLLGEALAGEGAQFTSAERSRRPGRSSTRSSKTTHTPTPTSTVAGGRHRPATLSLHTDAGTTPQSTRSRCLVE